MPFSRPSRPSRQSTAHSGRSERGLLRALSLIKQRQTEEDQPAPGALKERFFSKYNLSWTKLSQFLENRFPELKGTFEERVGIRPSDRGDFGGLWIPDH